MDQLETIKQTFFQECDELLADLEAGLLALESGEGDGETVNAVFRAVHSIKGGGGAFGLEPLVRFAHVFETALDQMRTGELGADPDTMKVMLRAADMLADHVAGAKGDGAVDAARSAAIAEELAALRARPDEAASAPAEDADPFGFKPLQVSLPNFDAPAPCEGWRIAFRPEASLYAKGHDPAILLRELARLGACDIVLDVDTLPPLDELSAEQSYLAWAIELRADVDEVIVRDLFDFVEGDCVLSLEKIESPAPITAPIIAFPSAPIESEPVAEVAIEPGVAKEQAKANKAAAQAAPAAAATIRVDLDRVDRLINLVGELVINQAMLAQRFAESAAISASGVAGGLDELEQLTREIQDSVMAIRAQPVKSVFQRMPRLVREIATSTGKEVRLVMEGEGTEVDKTVIERIAEPITHMLRNAIDHGLEKPEDRIAAGKPAEGVVTLSALHRSGRIVIEVADDGRGINRPRVRQIAVEKGLIAADAPLSDEETDNLIFLAGFSTASEVSDISGRGVGMDVVRRSIQALGGRISIASNPGKGSTFTLSLPLTLAVLDGMVVSAAGQTLVAPLSALIETLQPKRADVRRLGPDTAVLAVRGAFVPLIDVGVALGWRKAPIDPAAGVTVLVEREGGGRAALLVDQIQGQKQVVIKSLETNYTRVPGIAAATILGDGRVALILDVDAILDGRAREDLTGMAIAS